MLYHSLVCKTQLGKRAKTERKIIVGRVSPKRKTQMLKLIQRKKAKEKEIKNSEKFFRFFLHFFIVEMPQVIFFIDIERVYMFDLDKRGKIRGTGSEWKYVNIGGIRNVCFACCFNVCHGSRKT